MYHLVGGCLLLPDHYLGLGGLFVDFSYFCITSARGSDLCSDLSSDCVELELSSVSTSWAFTGHLLGIYCCILI